MKGLIVAAFATAAAAAPSAGTKRATKVEFAGVNMAGFDFGCGTDGNCVLGLKGAYDIVGSSNAIAQMNHFVKDDGLNALRLPVGWQYLTNGKVGGTLDGGNFGKYDKLVQGCLSSGAKLCILDIHNYARWNGQIIGQGGPTDDQFANIWSQLATKYKSESRIAFGLMNEPHDVPDITRWAQSCQVAVTAIRKAGATSQYILLPGNDYTSAGKFISNGSGKALLNVTDSDGSTSKLIFDVHKYLDSDNSGTHTNCVTDNIKDAFEPLATWLRDNKRMAFNSETGGGPNDQTCITNLCKQIQYLNQNADVYLGYTGWSAGGFDTKYELNEVPMAQGGGLADQPLVKSCIVGAWKNA